MTQTSLPAARAAFIDQNGRPTPEFYRFLETLATAQAGSVSPDEITAINAQLSELQAEIAALPSAEIPRLQVEFPILSQGLLQNGFAKLVLDQPGDSGTGALKGVTLDAWGRVTGTTDATITGTTGRVTVTNGDAAAGVPTIDLAPVANAGGGSLLKFVRDAWGRITGTSTPVVADLKSAGLVVPQGYIDGLQVVWNSAASISVTSGAAYIPSLGNVLASNATLTLSGLSLAASTWYHVYLYSNAGTPAIECVTTAPANYYGSAYQKTGDASRRYIASVLADPNGSVYNFTHNTCASCMYYQTSVFGAPFQAANGNASTATTVSCSAVIPVTGLTAMMAYSNNDQAVTVLLGNSISPPSSSPVAFLSQVGKNVTSEGELVLDGNKTFEYMFFSAPTANFVARIKGYYFDR